jgi:hypothetical protein
MRIAQSQPTGLLGMKPNWTFTNSEKKKKRLNVLTFILDKTRTSLRSNCVTIFTIRPKLRKRKMTVCSVSTACQDSLLKRYNMNLKEISIKVWCVQTQQRACWEDTCSITMHLPTHFFLVIFRHKCGCTETNLNTHHWNRRKGIQGRFVFDMWHLASIAVIWHCATSRKVAGSSPNGVF